MKHLIITIILVLFGLAAFNQSNNTPYSPFKNARTYILNIEKIKGLKLTRKVTSVKDGNIFRFDSKEHETEYKFYKKLSTNQLKTHKDSTIIISQEEYKINVKKTQVKAEKAKIETDSINKYKADLKAEKLRLNKEEGIRQKAIKDSTLRLKYSYLDSNPLFIIHSKAEDKGIYPDLIIKVYNNTNKRVKYITFFYKGYNPVDDIQFNQEVFKGIGFVEPYETANWESISALMDHRNTSKIVITKMIIKYETGEDKTIHNPKSIEYCDRFNYREYRRLKGSGESREYFNAKSYCD